MWLFALEERRSKSRKWGARGDFAFFGVYTFVPSPKMFLFSTENALNLKQ